MTDPASDPFAQFTPAWSGVAATPPAATDPTSAPTPAPAPTPVPGPAPARTDEDLSLDEFYGKTTDPTRLKVAVSGGLTSDPKVAAQILNASRTAGVPTDLVADNIKEIEAAARQSPEAQQAAVAALSDAKHTAAWIAENPHRAGLVADDLPRIAELERQIRGSNDYSFQPNGSIVRDLPGGRQKTYADSVELYRDMQGDDLMAQQYADKYGWGLGWRSDRLAVRSLLHLGSDEDEDSRRLIDQAQQLYIDSGDAGWAKRTFRSTVMGAPTFAVTLPLGGLIGKAAQSVAAATALGRTAAPWVLRAMTGASGMSPQAAVGAAHETADNGAGAGAASFLEDTAIAGAFGPIGPGRAALRISGGQLPGWTKGGAALILQHAGLNAAQNDAFELAHRITSYADGSNPDALNPGDLMGALATQGLIGGVAGAAFSGPEGLARARELHNLPTKARTDAITALERGENLRAIVESVDTLKATDLSPQSIKDMVETQAQGLPLTWAVDKTAWDARFVANGEDPREAAARLIGPGAYDDAHGGHIDVPLSSIAVDMRAQKDVQEWVLDNAKTSRDAASAAEAKETLAPVVAAKAKPEDDKPAGAVVPEPVAATMAAKPTDGTPEPSEAAKTPVTMGETGREHAAPEPTAAAEGSEGAKAKAVPGDLPGRPDLANPGDTKTLRTLVNEVDEVSKANPHTPANMKALAENAEKRVAKEPAQVEAELIARYAHGAVPTDVQVKEETELLRHLSRQMEAMPAGEEQAKTRVRLAALIAMKRAGGTEWGRSGRARRDDFQNPEQRRAQALVDVLGPIDPAFNEQIQKAMKDMQSASSTENATNRKAQQTRQARKQADTSKSAPRATKPVSDATKAKRAAARAEIAGLKDQMRKLWDGPAPTTGPRASGTGPEGGSVLLPFGDGPASPMTRIAGVLHQMALKHADADMGFHDFLANAMDAVPELRKHADQLEKAWENAGGKREATDTAKDFITADGKARIESRQKRLGRLWAGQNRALRAILDAIKGMPPQEASLHIDAVANAGKVPMEMTADLDALKAERKELQGKISAIEKEGKVHEEGETESKAAKPAPDPLAVEKKRQGKLTETERERHDRLMAMDDAGLREEYMREAEAAQVPDDIQAERDAGGAERKGLRADLETRDVTPGNGGEAGAKESPAALEKKRQVKLTDALAKRKDELSKLTTEQLRDRLISEHMDGIVDPDVAAERRAGATQREAIRSGIEAMGVGNAGKKALPPESPAAKERAHQNKLTENARKAKDDPKAPEKVADDVQAERDRGAAERAQIADSVVPLGPGGAAPDAAAISKAADDRLARAKDRAAMTDEQRRSEIDAARARAAEREGATPADAKAKQEEADRISKANAARDRDLTKEPLTPAEQLAKDIQSEEKRIQNLEKKAKEANDKLAAMTPDERRAYVPPKEETPDEIKRMCEESRKRLGDLRAERKRLIEEGRTEAQWLAEQMAAVDRSIATQHQQLMEKWTRLASMNEDDRTQLALGNVKPVELLMHRAQQAEAGELAEMREQIRLLEHPAEAKDLLAARMNTVKARLALESLLKKQDDQQAAVKARLKFDGFDVHDPDPWWAKTPDGYKQFQDALANARGNLTDKLAEYIVNALHFNIHLPLVKVASDAVNISANLAVLAGQRAVFHGGGGLAEMWGGITKEGLPSAWKAFVNGMTYGQQKIATPQGEAHGRSGKIGGYAGRVVRFSMQFVSAIDQAAKSFAAHSVVGMHAWESALKDGKRLEGAALRKHIADQMGDHDSDAWEKARAFADYVTFTEKNGLTNLTSKLSMRNLKTGSPLLDNTGKLAGAMLFPFTRVPTNIIAQGVMNLPFAALAVHAANNLGRPMGDTVEARVSEKARRTDQMHNDIIRGAISSIVTPAIWALVNLTNDDGTPVITGFADRDHPAEFQGVSYAKMGALANTIGFMVDGIRSAQGGNLGLAKGGALGTAWEHVRADSLLRNFTDIAESLKNPDRATEPFLMALIGAAVPAFVKEGFRNANPTAVTHRNEGFVDHVINATTNAGVPKVGPFGSLVTKATTGLPVVDWAYREVTPAQFGTQYDLRPSAVALETWNRDHPSDPINETQPDRKVRVGGKEVVVPEAEYLDALRNGGGLAATYARVYAEHAGLNEKQPTTEYKNAIVYALREFRGAAVRRAAGDEKAENYTEQDAVQAGADDGASGKWAPKR